MSPSLAGPGLLTRLLAATAIAAFVLPTLCAAEDAPTVPAEPLCRPCLEVKRERKTPLARNPINEFDDAEDWRGPYAFSCGRYFAVLAHSPEVASKACGIAERLYPSILAELGFSAPTDGSLYPMEIHDDRAEYRRRTHSPEWSEGHAYWNLIRTFNSWRLDRTLAHEITHLVLTENLRFNAPEFNWLGEGLADMVEWASMPEWERRGWPSRSGPRETMPFAEMP
jgi:hypothetical protein